MSTAPFRVLLIEDSLSDAKLLMHELRRAWPEAEFARVEDEPGLREAVNNSQWDVVISDWSLPKFSTLGALQVLHESGLDLPFIIASGTIGEASAVEAMRAGAHDYVLKDQLARLVPAVEREVRECKIRESHRRQEARFRGLIEKSAEGIIVSAADGAWLYMSPAAERIFGCSHAKVLGKRIVDFVHPDDRAKIAEAMTQVRTPSDETVATEFRIVHPDGSIHWIAGTSSNLIGDSAIGGIVSNVRDITEGKSAAEALRRSEARFAKLSESGIVGIITADFDGRFLDVNDAYLKMIGYTREELISGSVHWNDVIAPDQRALTTQMQAPLVTLGIAPAWETAAVAKDGTRVPMLVGAALLDATTVVAFCADLTEKKRVEEHLRKTEEHLRQAQKMEAVGRLAGGIAHDFNNVLSVVLSYAEVLLFDIEEGSPMRDDVEEIRKAGERAAELTRQLLMFSRQQVLAPKVIDLNDLLSDMTKMLKRVVGEDIDLSFSRAPSLGLVRADPSSLEQVIMNLVVNARDAMPTGGTLTIETGNVVLDEEHSRAHGCSRTGPHVLLRASDTGVGMDEATQSRIFEPFFTTKSNDKGTGLGLSTVFGIVEQSGGCVSVESQIGKGTTFKIYLPCEEGVTETKRAVVTPKDDRGTETVLLVEDEEQVRTVARGILQRLGYRVLEARNAGEALLSCEKHEGEIHLLLSDIVMPQMSGPELAKRLSSMRPHMKVLFMSGYTDDSIMRHGVLNADIEFLHKPFTPSAIARKVREVLDAPLRS